MTEAGSTQPAVDEEINAENGGGAPMTILERLRQQRTASLRNTTHTITIPGTDGLLLCEYHVVDSEAMRARGKIIQKQFRDEADQRYAAQLDTLIQACEQIMVYDPEVAPQPIPLHEHPQIEEETPIKYDQRLAAFLALEDGLKARRVVEEVFLNNDIAITRHWAELIDWMSDTSADVAEEELGE